MTDAMTIAISGLVAQGQRLAATASNIANINTTGAVPTAESASTVYRPLSVSYSALVTAPGLMGGGGGVRATVTADPNGWVPVFDPLNNYANNEGLIAAPAVDLAKEFTSILEIKASFKANLAVIKTHHEMMGEILDTIA